MSNLKIDLIVMIVFVDVDTGPSGDLLLLFGMSSTGFGGDTGKKVYDFFRLNMKLGKVNHNFYTHITPLHPKWAIAF